MLCHVAQACTWFGSRHPTCRATIFHFLLTWQITTQLCTQFKEGVSLLFSSLHYLTQFLASRVVHYIDIDPHSSQNSSLELTTKRKNKLIKFQELAGSEDIKKEINKLLKIQVETPEEVKKQIDKLLNLKKNSQNISKKD